MSESYQLIRLAVVLEMTGLSKTSLYEAISANEFPKNVKISERSSAWVCQEVTDWIKEKIEARSQGGEVMNTQQPTIYQRTNTVVCIKKAIDRLSKDVAYDIQYDQAQLIYFDVIEDLNTAFNELHKTATPSRDIRGAKELIDRCIELISRQPSEESQIELLERGTSEYVSKQDVEDKNDLAIDFLNGALSRLGYFDPREVK